MENKNPSPEQNSGALTGEPSFRILYYGATGAAVPFKWESQPGTPKHHLTDGTSLPPLTPPPAYYSGESPAKTKAKSKKTRMSLRRLVSRSSSHVTSESYSSSSTSSSGDYFSPSPLLTPARKAGTVFMCFGVKTPFGNGGCNVKNALYSVVACRGSSSRSVDYVV